MKRAVKIKIMLVFAICAALTTGMVPVCADAEEVYVIGEDIGSESQESVMDYTDLYTPVLDGIIEYSQYSLHDIDNDGVSEMIVGYGSTADYINMVWTADTDGRLDFVGYFYLPQSFYTAPDGNGIYGVYGHMGYELVTRYTIADGLIVEERVSEQELVEDYYSNDMPIAAYDVSDRSILEKSSGQTASESSIESSGSETVNIYGTYSYDNGVDNVMTAEIGYNTDGDEGDYLYIEALSYGDRYTVIFYGMLVDEGNGVYRSTEYEEASCALEVTISNEGMQVSVTQTAYDSWLVLDGYYEKISSFDPNSVS
ncbi:MAG: hypothetical protein LUG99_11820 [Lachnospiraceae bacterium]|nr:hypothetical protein [Lachnospiraceae bacterium]